jgi:hypothetical protein
LERATYWSIFATKLGSSTALATLYDLVVSGEAKFKPGYGPPTSFDASALIRAAAEGGDASAQFKLAELLEKRAKENDQDVGLLEAVSWYRKSALKGFKDAKEALKRLKVSETE